MERDSGLINLIVALIVILGSVAGALAQAWQRIRKVGTEGEAAPGPGSDLEGEGGELRARPAPRHGNREPRVRAAPSAATDEEKSGAASEATIPPAGAEPVPVPAPEPAKGRPRLSLDERIFANRRLTFGARLVLAKEILDGPRGRRPRR